MSLQLEERVKELYDRKNNIKTKMITALLIIVAVLVLILVIIILNHRTNKYKSELAEANAQVQELMDEAVLLEKVSKTISTEEIETEINKIGELATVEYLYTDAGKFEDSNQIKGFNIPFTKKSFIVKWSGTIKAGINLENVKTEIDEDNKEIIVYLPKSEILSHTHDPDGFEILDESNSIFNPIEVDDVNTFTTDNDSFTQQKAIERGLLEKADENAQTIIENSLNSNIKINGNYEIVIITSDETDSSESTEITTE